MAAPVIRQSTARTLMIGPYVDADGVALTGLSPAPTFSKNAAPFVARSSADAIAHAADGWYTCPVDTTDTNTVGTLLVQDADAAHLPVWHEVQVVEEQIYDALFGSGAAGYSTYAGGDTAGTTTLLSRLTATRAGYLDVLNGILAAIWAYATRTLTQSAASVTAAVTGTSVTTVTHSTWTVALTGLPSMAARSKVWLIIFRDAEAADADAVVLCDSVSGLTRIDGAAYATGAHGALTFPSDTALTLTLNHTAAALVGAGVHGYAVKLLTTGGDTSYVSSGGTWIVKAGAPQAIS